MALFITPKDFMNEYYHLDVRLDDGSVETVKVDHYRNNDEKLPLLKAHHKTVQARNEVMHPLTGLINAAIKKDPNEGIIDGSPLDMAAIRLSFVGKGMPDDIRLTLRLAVRHGKAHKGRLQEFCNNYIGLDCNGFVGNYMLRRGQKRFGTNRAEGGKKADWIGISELNRHAYRRKNASDILANDLLVWDAIHVAVIDKVYQAGSTVEFDVVESHPFGYTPAGAKAKNGGLQLSRYRLVTVNMQRGVMGPTPDRAGKFRVTGGPSGTTSAHIVDAGLAWPWDQLKQAMDATARTAMKAVATPPIPAGRRF
jgi:hypothetical protein